MRPPRRRRTAAVSLSALAATLIPALVAGPAAAHATALPNGRGVEPIRYVALGDSYTAAPFVPVTDPAGGCFRSNHNYPSLIAAALGVASFRDVSCSGARTADLTGSQVTPLGPVAPQQDALGADTTLVTVSLGGNDEGVFGTMIGVCASLAATPSASGTPCRDHFATYGSHDTLTDAARRTAGRVEDVVRTIHAKAPRARVVVVGYPVLVPKSGSCTNLPFAPGDYSFARGINLTLNESLKQGAHRGGAEYVDVARASAGHDACAGADAWINGPVTDMTKAQAFHPFAAEQAAVADLVLTELSRGAGRA